MIPDETVILSCLFDIRECSLDIIYDILEAIPWFGESLEVFFYARTISDGPNISIYISDLLSRLKV